jgi:hypothetical protein
MTNIVRRANAAAMLVAACLLALSCTGGTVSTTPTQTIASQIASTATLTILSPKEGQTIHGSTVDVKVNLKGGHLVVPTTTDIQPDEGHLHITIDDLPVTMTASLNQKVPNVTPGEHLLTVEFVAGNHLPFDPRVLAKVGFKVSE